MAERFATFEVVFRCSTDDYEATLDALLKAVDGVLSPDCQDCETYCAESCRMEVASATLHPEGWEDDGAPAVEVSVPPSS